MPMAFQCDRDHLVNITMAGQWQYPTAKAKGKARIRARHIHRIRYGATSDLEDLMVMLRCPDGSELQRLHTRPYITM